MAEQQLVKAQAKYLKGSPRKAKPVIDTIKGLPVEEALASLKYMNKKFATKIYKVVNSAVANAENNYNLDRERLVVKNAYVGAAPMFKRFRAESRGRGRLIQKRNSHITVWVGYPEDSKQEAEQNIKSSEAAVDAKTQEQESTAANNK